MKFAWKNTKIPDELLAFFGELFNIKKTTLLKDYYEDTDDEENDLEDVTDTECLATSKSAKIGSLFSSYLF